jgi:hypothetical protein
VWRSSEPLPPADGLGSRGPEGIPRVGGWRFSGHLTITRCLHVYWIILDALLFLTTSPGKAGLRVQAGDRHTRVNGAACRGPPVVRERSGIIRTLRPIGSRVLLGWSRGILVNQTFKKSEKI